MKKHIETKTGKICINVNIVVRPALWLLNLWCDIILIHWNIAVIPTNCELEAKKQIIFSILHSVLIDSMINFCKRTSFTDTLIIFCWMWTNNFRFFHLYAKVFFYKVYGRQDGKIRVTLAAAGSADFSDSFQRFCCHVMGKSIRFLWKRCGFW